MFVSKQNLVTVQQWETTELGLGIRPDGYSIHLSSDDLRQFTKDLWLRESKTDNLVFSKPVGTPYKSYVDDETYFKLRQTKHGLKIHTEHEL